MSSKVSALSLTARAGKLLWKFTDALNQSFKRDDIL